MRAYIFPGQGSQFVGMGKELCESSPLAKELFEKANEILGFRITDIMFGGTEDDLRQTKVTQPAIFLHSVILAKTLETSPLTFATANSSSGEPLQKERGTFNPDMVAGHSLGEFSALVANRSLSFEDGLKLVAQRAFAMQKACEAQPSTMAAVLGLDDKIVEEVCATIDDVVVPANYNCPGQLVISGSVSGVNKACEQMKAAGAKRALLLPVGGAFHSPLMEPARKELETAINNTAFNSPICPIYQNVNARAVIAPEKIKKNLIAQLTAPVRWTQTIQNMSADGATTFFEIGPGKVLQGLVKKIKNGVEAMSVEN